MIVLGFDTATPATAVALRLADGTTLRADEDADPHGRPGHTTRLLVLAHALLAQAGVGWGEVGLIGVGVGPGTFTGLRIGVATARGLAQSLDVDVAGVSTLRVLASAALGEPAAVAGHGAALDEPATEAAHRAAPTGRPGRGAADGAARGVLAVLDARRGQAFVGAYAAAGAGGEVCELLEPRALDPDALADVPAAAGGGREWLAVGDGAVLFARALRAGGIAVAAQGSPLHRVDAGVLCELALDTPRGAPEEVLPDYRRRPDAEIALESSAQP